MPRKTSRVWVTRASRIAALIVGVGIIAPGAGNWLGMDAVVSALFGGVLVGTGVVGTLLLIYASKAEVTDRDFNKAINDAIESVRSERSNDK